MDIDYKNINVNLISPQQLEQLFLVLTGQGPIENLNISIQAVNGILIKYFKNIACVTTMLNLLQYSNYLDVKQLCAIYLNNISRFYRKFNINEKNNIKKLALEIFIKESSIAISSNNFKIVNCLATLLSTIYRLDKGKWDDLINFILTQYDTFSITIIVLYPALFEVVSNTNKINVNTISNNINIIISQLKTGLSFSKDHPDLFNKVLITINYIMSLYGFPVVKEFFMDLLNLLSSLAQTSNNSFSDTVINNFTAVFEIFDTIFAINDKTFMKEWLPTIVLLFVNILINNNIDFKIRNRTLLSLINIISFHSQFFAKNNLYLVYCIILLSITNRSDQNDEHEDNNSICQSLIETCSESLSQLSIYHHIIYYLNCIFSVYISNLHSSNSSDQTVSFMFSHLNHLTTYNTSQDSNVVNYIINHILHSRESFLLSDIQVLFQKNDYNPNISFFIDESLLNNSILLIASLTSYNFIYNYYNVFSVYIYLLIHALQYSKHIEMVNNIIDVLTALSDNVCLLPFLNILIDILLTVVENDAVVLRTRNKCLILFDSILAQLNDSNIIYDYTTNIYNNESLIIHQLPSSITMVNEKVVFDNNILVQLINRIVELIKKYFSQASNIISASFESEDDSIVTFIQRTISLVGTIVEILSANANSHISGVVRSFSNANMFEDLELKAICPNPVAITANPINLTNIIDESVFIYIYQILKSYIDIQHGDSVKAVISFTDVVKARCIDSLNKLLYCNKLHPNIIQYYSDIFNIISPFLQYNNTVLNESIYSFISFFLEVGSDSILPLVSNTIKFIMNKVVTDSNKEEMETELEDKNDDFDDEDDEDDNEDTDVTEGYIMEKQSSIYLIASVFSYCSPAALNYFELSEVIEILLHVLIHPSYVIRESSVLTLAKLMFFINKNTPIPPDHINSFVQQYQKDSITEVTLTNDLNDINNIISIYHLIIPNVIERIESDLDNELVYFSMSLLFNLFQQNGFIHLFLDEIQDVILDILNISLQSQHNEKHDGEDVDMVDRFDEKAGEVSLLFVTFKLLGLLIRNNNSLIERYIDAIFELMKSNHIASHNINAIGGLSDIFNIFSPEYLNTNSNFFTHIVNELIIYLFFHLFVATSPFSFNDYIYCFGVLQIKFGQYFSDLIKYPILAILNSQLFSELSGLNHNFTTAPNNNSDTTILNYLITFLRGLIHTICVIENNNKSNNNSSFFHSFPNINVNQLLINKNIYNLNDWLITRDNSISTICKLLSADNKVLNFSATEQFNLILLCVPITHDKNEAIHVYSYLASLLPFIDKSELIQNIKALRHFFSVVLPDCNIELKVKEIVKIGIGKYLIENLYNNIDKEDYNYLLQLLQQ